MPRSNEAPFVGRAVPAANLREFVSATRGGDARRVIVVGPAGIGKSTLLRNAVRSRSARGVLVVHAAADQLDHTKPAETLRRILRSAPQLADGLDQVGTSGDPRDGFCDRIGEFLAGIAAKQPILIILDDLQWVDEASATALRVLIGQLFASPVSWLVGCRPITAQSSASEVVDTLLEHDAHKITLEPLSKSEVRDLAAALLRAKPDARLCELLTHLDGHPLRVSQAVKTLRSERQLTYRDGGVSVRGDDPPRSLVASVEAEIRGLSEPERSLLMAGALLRRPFTLYSAHQLVGTPLPDLMKAAEKAIERGILRAEDDAHLAFCHDFYLDTVYEQVMSPPIRTAMHREAVNVVLAEGRSVVEAAEHAKRGGPGGDDKAISVLCKAAGELAASAPASAAGYLVHALHIMPRQHPDRSRSYAEAIGLLAAAGQYREAIRIGTEALSGNVAEVWLPKVLLGMAATSKQGGHNHDAISYAQRGLAQPMVAEATQARLYAVKAHAQVLIGDMAAAEESGIHADRLGALTGNAAARVSGHEARSAVARATGRLTDALILARTAVDLAEGSGRADHHHPHIWVGCALTAMDRFPEARAELLSAARQARQLGTGWSLPLTHFHSAYLLIAEGRLIDAVTEVEAGLTAANTLGARQLCVPLHGLLAQIAVLRRQRVEASAQLRLLDALVAGGITETTELVAWPHAVYEMAERRWQRAMDRLAPIFDALPDQVLLFTYEPGSAAEMVRTAMAAGQPERAAAAAAAMRRLAELNAGVGSFAGAALHAEGLLHHDRGALDAAVVALSGRPRPLMLARALEDAADAAFVADDRSTAVKHVERALGIYTDCDAHQAAERVRHRRARLGVRSSGAQAGPGSDSRLDGLSPTQRDVARAVNRGLKNKEIAEELAMAPSTVDGHLRKIFAALKIKSRAVLSRIVAEEDRGEP